VTYYLVKGEEIDRLNNEVIAAAHYEPHSSGVTLDEPHERDYVWDVPETEVASLIRRLLFEVPRLVVGVSVEPVTD
jgi:hypothetical protein